jgi:FKBP-type peptidyl-prolyl cis-trans isomerase
MFKYKNRAMNLLSAAGLIISLAGCTKPSLSDDADKESYAMGYRIGTSIKNEKITFNSKVLFAGLEDGFKGKSDLTDQQTAEAFARMKSKSSKVYQDEAELGLQAATKFFDGNKSQPGVLETASGLQYQIISEGNGPRPKKDQAVRVHYVGTLLDGSKFDSSVDRGQPAEFQVGQVVAGWQEALQLMPAGSKWKLFVHPKLAYGASPRPKIPPNSTLIFEVELLEIVSQKAGVLSPATKPAGAGAKKAKPKA